jgi:cold shock CspA family protein
LKRYSEAIDVASHVIKLSVTPAQGIFVLTLALRAAVYEVRDLIANGFIDRPVEVMEEVIELCECSSVEFLAGEAIDRLLQVVELANEFKLKVDEEFFAKKLSEFASRAIECVRRASSTSCERKVGVVKAKRQDKLFGFVTWKSRDYFFHLRDLDQESEWDHILTGGLVAFIPLEKSARGPRAGTVRWID